jgi:hypothetical protein
LLAVVGVLVALLLAAWHMPAAQAQVSEGKVGNLIAIATNYGNESLLYLVDADREVILVYGFHQPGSGLGRNPRTGVFEFLAGRLYRWDALLASKREYAIRGVRTLQGLRVNGPGSSEEEYKRTSP